MFQRSTNRYQIFVRFSGARYSGDVSVTFHAINQDIMLYWVGSDGSETRIDHIWKGESFDEVTYPNHKFRTYNAYNKDEYVDHVIDVNFGEHKNIHVEL